MSWNFGLVVDELFTTGQLSRRKLAYLLRRLNDPTADLTTLERERIYAHPLIRDRMKDLAP